MVAGRSAGSRMGGPSWISMRVLHLKHARDPGGLLAWQTGHSTIRPCILFTIAFVLPSTGSIHPSACSFEGVALHRIEDFFFVRFKRHDRPALSPSTALWLRASDE